MAHDHHHHHGESARDYFVEQLLTIFVVGALGAVGILMYRDGKLGYILAAPFHLPVLIGGIAVLVLVAVRAVAVWQEAGQAHAHPHHEHGPDCNHDHGPAEKHGHPVHLHAHDHPHEHGPECDHDHGPAHAHADDQRHDHDHGADDHGHSHDLTWVFARMMVLFFPVALYLIGVPNSGFSQERISGMLGKEAALGVSVENVATGEGTVLSFNDLNEAAYDASKREALDGTVGILVGRFDRIADKEFRLYRLKMTCCAADTVPLKVRILTRSAVSGFNSGEWVKVKGEVRFVQPPGSAQFIPVIAVGDLADVQRTAALNEYE
ncbi:MAG TPA: hypothetical protein VD866_13940 [Urbifossiella sp.]|nr:hypothetical protein [Urbifossiella sp.]